MWNVIGGILQIIFLLLKNKFEKDAKEKERKKELTNESKDAILSRDPTRIVGILDKLQRK